MRSEIFFSGVSVKFQKLYVIVYTASNKTDFTAYCLHRDYQTVWELIFRNSMALENRAPTQCKSYFLLIWNFWMKFYQLKVNILFFEGAKKYFVYVMKIIKL